ncbi:cation transporter [Candidatus Uhrbacteria bacterium CG10_big_fil_rev_8_21_14_0_10_48_11]|uniref:Cation transporter n=1 Tax=Candidatus Uhrbacteria bacterium CG10_big_fil_rev_8_21_14_0_10_48_11 TaxID=1975037 RepID=A0A2M8LEV4_9BACT|nr:MAG: cation transporter [Candidatus Uhrbacteria bacterium CG10_big_fil_rev_8_21_14_0_10_48_11]
MSDHNYPTTSKNLIWSISINVIIVIAEIIFGILARSMALISEALHNFTDIGSMTLSWWGEKVMTRPNTSQKTFGYKRAEVIIAFVNGGVLLGVSGWVLIESTIRIFHPEQVAGFTMLIVAIVSLVGNGIATYLLQAGADKNLNLKSAWLHSIQDALFSLGVVIAAIIIYYTGWNWVDPIVSISVSIFLFKEVYEILSESVDILLDSVPEGLVLEEIKEFLSGFSGVKNVSDLHVWQTGSNDRFLSVHLITNEISSNERTKILAEIIKLLKEKYNIHHPTLQMVSEREINEIGLECGHCN